MTAHRLRQQPAARISREQKIEIVTHALKHLGIGHSVTSKGATDEVIVEAGDGRIAFRPDGSIRQAILDRRGA